MRALDREVLRRSSARQSDHAAGGRSSALTGEKRITFEDRVQVPQLTIAWPSVGGGSADQPALDLLSDILGNSRTAWINKALVYDKQLAANVTVFQNPERSRRDASRCF